MVEELAVLAVLVAADMGMTARVIAENYNISERAVQSRLDELKEEGAVLEKRGLYYAEENAGAQLSYRSTTATPGN